MKHAYVKNITALLENCLQLLWSDIAAKIAHVYNAKTAVLHHRVYEIKILRIVPHFFSVFSNRYVYFLIFIKDVGSMQSIDTVYTLELIVGYYWQTNWSRRRA